MMMMYARGSKNLKNCIQASAGNGETAEREDDPLCNAAKGYKFFVLRISL